MTRQPIASASLDLLLNEYLDYMVRELRGLRRTKARRENTQRPTIFTARPPAQLRNHDDTRSSREAFAQQLESAGYEIGRRLAER